MISISSVQFDTSGWELLESKFDEIMWRDNDNATLIALHYFSKKPNIACPLAQIDELRRLYRQVIARNGGGIISMDVVNVCKIDCLELICKVPQQPTGMCYFASLTIPFADFSFVVKLECPELGVTGFREAVVISDIMASGQAHINVETGNIDGWSCDPYDSEFKGPALRNLSEDEKYDQQFPQHPLSRARKLMSAIKQSMKLEDNLYAAKQFTQ